jgi:glycosyltransferase involved in cell wall biosynthesis
MSLKPSSVLLVTPRWARDGGVGAHVMASAALLARHGTRVVVLAARIEADEDIPGVTLYRRPELSKPDVPVAQRLGEALSFEPDVIHLHQVDDPEIARALRAAAPVVVSAHGYTACSAGAHYFRPGQECDRAHGPGCVPNMVLRGCAHTSDLPRTLTAKYRYAGRGLAALQCADLAVSYSSAVDRHLIDNGIERRVVLPYFPTMAPVTGSGHASRRRVVFAGRVVMVKGVSILIRAARAVDGEFVVCGDGWQLEAMRKLARRLGVADRVRFTGWLDAQALGEELANASVVAVPSVWPEPFGLVGIEAFAAGRPVVASATGGVTDWLQDGVSGLTVRPGDAAALAKALEQLLGDPDRQRAMGRAGRETVAARFSPERHLQALIDAYQAARSSWLQRGGAGAA